MWKNLRAVLAFILFCIGIKVQATHIVGGNITYKCLSKDIYEVTVVVRRDCFNGDPEAFFDNPASVGIFDRTGEIVGSLGTKGQLLIRLSVNDTLTPIREDLCSLEGSKSICVHETTYRGTVFLPFRAGGYYLEYQRCCRNVPIQNITAPLETGASWIVHISEEAMKSCNSTPVFKKWSPIFICVGKPYIFDHGAIDPDGDSLVYRMWTPFTGASKAFPKPQPPNKPDFNPVGWQTPYSEADMLGGDPLRIDSKTGALYAVPNAIGQYLLGVQVQEYRNGVLLSTVYRDYEVSIIDCANLVDAAIKAPSLQCDNLTVNFVNESINSKKQEWFFDFDRNKNARSTEFSPTYRYTDTGTYKVALVITLDSMCFDTAFHIIQLKNSSSTGALFTTVAGECINGSLKLSLIDLSTGVTPGAIYSWTIKYSNQTITSALKSPVITIPNGVVATITLTISEAGLGCSVTAAKTLTTSFIQPEFHLDQQVVCTGDTTTIKFILADSIKVKYTYTWDANPLIIAGGTTAEPVIVSKTNQSLYLYVTVDNKNGCTSRDSILIISRAKPKLAYTFINACGSLAIKVKNESDPLTDYAWNFGDGATSIEREPAHTYAKAGRYTVTLSTKQGCAPSLSKTFNIGDTACLNLIDSVDACIGRTIGINPRANPNYSYQWRPTTKLSALNIPNPLFVVDSARTFIADLFDLNTGIGVGTLTIHVRTPSSDEIKLIRDTVLACSGVGIGLNPGGNPALIYEWSPAQFLDNANAINPIATVTNQTIFSVKVTNPKDSCVQSKNVIVVIPSRIAADLIPDSLQACNGVPINLNPNGKSDSNLKYIWSPGNVLDDSTKHNPLATISSPTEFTVTITDIRFADCRVIKKVKVSIPLIDELAKIKDSIKVCAGVPTPLNPIGDARFKYEWSPTTGLDNANLANPKATVNQNTTYSVKITDTQRGNCVLSKEVKVIVAPAFTIVPSFRDSTSCSATSFLLRVGSNNPNVKFEWFLPSGARLGTGDTITVRPIQKTVYRVVGTDEFGCQRADSVSVDPAKITIDAQLLGTGRVCQGDSVRLQVVGQTPGQVLTYQWTPTNTILSGGTTANPLVRPTTNTTYTVLVTNRQGCRATDSVTVTVSAFADVTATANPTTIQIGQTSQITATSRPGYTYKWVPAETLDNPNISNPVAKPRQTTTYTLTVTNPEGCVKTLQVTIIVNIPDCAEPFIFIPNAFSPNGDGKNDILFVRGNIIVKMSLIIYNRWGEKVFETINQSVGWDGTFRGKLLDPDVYGFYLTADCIDGKTFAKKGNVTILR